MVVTFSTMRNPRLERGTISTIKGNNMLQNV